MIDISKIRTLADALIATAEPNKYWDDLDNLSLEECKHLDTMAFECSCCNQWYSIHEKIDKDDEWLCKDCGK